MEESAAIVRLDRKSSIDTEPRTLDIHQMQLARDAALNVMRTADDDALRIFTEGLKPVVSVSEQNHRLMRMMDNSEDEFDYSLMDDSSGIHSGIREIASAPF
ncbi:uncharacterized protein LOC127804683 [Diospyros lotus]|uniref:uncharacterized protein LOC127804683 n=1 Tax=Diospyros lotus TaxID=55363 RepID=UPI00224D57C8|nr:uncharacterized protein LOC127804683 [Diospyros lotus]